MCFSAGASFTAAGVILVIGLLTLHKVRDRRILPFALTPLLFAVQQAAEGIIWLTAGEPSSWILMFATYFYAIYAGFFWPVWIPYTLSVAERNGARKRLLQGILVVGSCVGILALMATLLFGITVSAETGHIAYRFMTTTCVAMPRSVAAAWWLLYLVAVVGSFFVSTVTYAWIAGALVAAGLGVAYIVYTAAIGSVWCFFAALVSMMSYWVVDRYKTS